MKNNRPMNNACRYIWHAAKDQSSTKLKGTWFVKYQLPKGL
jgi:hypothetical protein